MSGSAAGAGAHGPFRGSAPGVVWKRALMLRPLAGPSRVVCVSRGLVRKLSLWLTPCSSAGMLGNRVGDAVEGVAGAGVSWEPFPLLTDAAHPGWMPTLSLSVIAPGAGHGQRARGQ